MQIAEVDVTQLQRLNAEWSNATITTRRAFLLFTFGETSYFDQTSSEQVAVLNDWSVVSSKGSTQCMWPFNDLDDHCFIKGLVEGTYDIRVTIQPLVIRKRFILDALTGHLYKLGTVSDAYSMFLRRLKCPPIKQGSPFGLLWERTNKG